VIYVRGLQMILPGHVIQQYVEQGMISVQPLFDERQLRAFGLRVHLGPTLLIPDQGQQVDLGSPHVKAPSYSEHDLRSGPYVLKRGEFVIASTVELFQLHPSLLCRMEGRSTLSRLGLLAHCASGVVDNNHREHRSVVLELANIGAFEIVLPFGIGIGMATFERVAGEAEARFDQNQYEGQTGSTPANLDFKVPAYAGLKTIQEE
jgi:deoxycytidine triphosphate deaminase